MVRLPKIVVCDTELQLTFGDATSSQNSPLSDVGRHDGSILINREVYSL